MNFKQLFAFTLAVALAGCSVPIHAPVPGATADSATSSDSTPLLEASLPFKTVAVDPEGQGRFFKSGPSETLVLHSKAELDAFIGRHSPAVQPVYGPPNPSASAGPPSGIPYGTQPPAFVPDPLPEALTGLDFDKFVAIAFFDGEVKVASASRIIAVKDQEGQLAASTRRWEPPPNPAAVPDLNGRLHVIALAKTSAPVAFLPLSVVDGTSPNGGGYGVGGNPIMRPQWPAVPNPEITRELVEHAAKDWAHAQSVAGFELKLATVSEAVGEPNGTPFTSDSLVWYARISGQLDSPISKNPMPGTIGASAPVTGEVRIVISPEDGGILQASTSLPPQSAPLFRFELRPNGDLHLGEPLHFDVSGVPVDGEVTMTLRSGTASPVVKQIAFKDLSTFALTLDSAHLPFLTGAVLQPLSIELKYETAPGQVTTEGHEVHVLKDATAQQSPPMAVQGPGTLAEYNPEPGETAADAFVRGIAVRDWQGTSLVYASHMSTLTEMHPKGNYAVDLAPTTPVRVYDVRGTFPTFLVPAITSITDADEVMSPVRLEFGVTESLPIRVVSLKAYPR